MLLVALANGQAVSDELAMGDITQVAAAIITDSGRVLVTRRASGQKLEGFWEFPGGKLLANETPQACVEREIEEELALTVQAGEILATSVHHYPGSAIELIAVAAEVLGGEIALSVHDEYDWCVPSELMKLHLAPADIPIAEVLATILPSQAAPAPATTTAVA